MRYLSKIFQPVISIPKNANIKNNEITCRSQKLLLECGLIRPTSSGLFTLLPLARRALDKLESLIKTCIEEAGAQRISLPALTTANLWEKTGRLEEIGTTELLMIEDRHKKKFLLAPTHEEAMTDLLADVGPLSYKQLPILLYQINNKYRDEVRPKHGLLRAREFTMLDAYGAHNSKKCAENVYETVCKTYEEIFRRLELPVYKVEAPTGDMGGSLSHEWQLCAGAGEDLLDVCVSCSHVTRASERERCGICEGKTERVHSIEIGHTFLLGTRYSEPLQAHFIPPSGPQMPLYMSCYGIGITRLMAASLEALSSERNLRWPPAIAPYTAVIIGPKEGSKEWSSHGIDRVEQIFDQLTRNFENDVLIDDRHGLTIGKRLMMADRIGYPIIIVCGKSALESPPRYEVYRSLPGAESTPQLMTLDQLTSELQEKNTNNVKRICNKV